MNLRIMKPTAVSSSQSAPVDCAFGWGHDTQMLIAPQFGIKRRSLAQTTEASPIRTQTTVCDDVAANDWHFTHHAQTRLQQRGIQKSAVDILLEWGTASYTGTEGRQTLFFSKLDLQRLSEHLPKQQLRSLDKRRHLFAIIGADGAVVTVGFRFKHMTRH